MRHVILLPAFVLFACVTACGDDDTGAPGTSSSSSSSSTSSSSSSSGSSGAYPGEAAIAGCPSQDTLIEGAKWVSCVAGRSMGGTEPFTNKACELKFDADGGLTYSLAGAATLTAPKASWGSSATGTYTNSGSGASRIFLASVTPELPFVEGQPQLLGVNVSIFGVGKSEDTIEIKYLDVGRARQVYNCTITSP